MNRIPLYLSFLAALLSGVLLYVCPKSDRKVGYVIVSELYDNFEFKKELENKYVKTRNARKKILDSLEIDLSVLNSRVHEMPSDSKVKIIFEDKKLEYFKKKELFDQDNSSQSKQYDEQIIKQLNQYISDFGKENKFDMIYGNTSGGSIMYGIEELNITKSALEYINNKHRGL